MADLFTIDTLPTTSQAAIREFDDRYIAAQGTYSPNKWFDMLGTFSPTNSPDTTFPINQIGLLFQATKGENRFKNAIEKSIQIKSTEFDEGIKAKLMDLFTNSFAWARWQQGPSLLVTAEEWFRGKQVSTLIEAGETTLSYDGKYFFDDDHPINPGDSSVGTYDNLDVAGLDVISVANIQAQITQFRLNCKDENGNNLDFGRVALGVPTAKYEGLKNLLKKEQIASAAGTASETNPYGDGSIEVVHMPQLTDVNDWYVFAPELYSMIPPWLALKLSVPGSLATRVYDESSELFRDTGQIAYSAHIWYGFGLAFPQGIRKVTGA
jgi:hypothetical protein